MVSAIRFPRRIIVPIALLVLIAIIWASDLTGYLTWAGFSRRQAVLTAWAESHPLLAPSLFVLLYVVTVTMSLPQGGLLTLAGGFLFGTIVGGVLAIVGATIGAAFLFLVARSAFGELLSKRGGAALDRLRGGLERDGFSYLLALRLIPMVPFWLINLAAGVSGMRLRPFVLATLIGIMPATFIIASVGSGLGMVISQGGKPDASILFSWPVLGPLLALAFLSLTPVIWRKFRAGNA